MEESLGGTSSRLVADQGYVLGVSFELPELDVVC
jgi:hypothetical protein